MCIFQEALSTAFALILQRDADLVEIIGLSMQVSLTALFVACLLGLPLGALMGSAPKNAHCQNRRSADFYRLADIG